MKTTTLDSEYMGIINDIYNNEEFQKLKKFEHHGVTRFEHSIRVSYYSYKLSKILKLDYEKVARAGLLHDFFLSSNNRKNKEKFISIFKHPKASVINSLIYFDLTEKEIDIIRCHMFPINFKIPKYIESWLVSFIDKIVAVYEFSCKIFNIFKLKYATNIYILFLINFFL